MEDGIRNGAEDIAQGTALCLDGRPFQKTE